MEFNSNEKRRVSNHEMKVGHHIISQVTQLKYLGPVIQNDGELEEDVNHKFQYEWLKQRMASGIFRDTKVPLKLKGKFYWT